MAVTVRRVAKPYLKDVIIAEISGESNLEFDYSNILIQLSHNEFGQPAGITPLRGVLSLESTTVGEYYYKISFRKHS